MKISLIIPVYNVEKYLARCIQSCIRQDLPLVDYEIILVNDGSTDGSLSIAEDFARNYRNISVITQTNSGLSAARNKGLSVAKGDYVWFIDSDDKIEENCLGRVSAQIYNENLDLLSICNAKIIESVPIRRRKFTDFTVYDGVYVLNNIKIDYCSPFTIYRRSFLREHDLLFMPGVFHEDNEFTPRVYYYAQRVGRTNDILYYVTVNPNSISRTINPKRAFDCITISKSLFDFVKDKEEVKSYFYDEISLLVNNALSIIVQSRNNDDKYSLAEFSSILNKSKYLFKCLTMSAVAKYKLEGVLFRLFPSRCIQIYKNLQKIKMK